MKCYIVVFETALETTRVAIRAKLRAYGKSCPLTKQAWAVASDQTAVQIRDDLKEALPPGDRVYVFRSGTEGAWKNAYGKANSEWLKKYL
jgi:hypothetical protein